MTTSFTQGGLLLHGNKVAGPSLGGRSQELGSRECQIRPALEEQGKHLAFLMRSGPEDSTFDLLHSSSISSGAVRLSPQHSTKRS
jgi:hypothetical protein